MKIRIVKNLCYKIVTYDLVMQSIGKNLKNRGAFNFRIIFPFNRV